MKLTSLFSLLALGLLSCSHEPELPATPHIEFDKIEFFPANQSNPDDALVLHILFSDGDGDLGLAGDQIDPPYHEANYFTDDNGKLLTIRSRNDPRYSYLPPFEPPYDCMNYTDDEKTTYFLPDVLDATFNIVDTQEINGVTYYGVRDHIYYERNEDHYNIEVDFLERAENGEFKEYDWRKEFCNQSFDGRFPTLGDGQQILEGKLAYSMESIGIRQVFSIKTIKLRVTIKDRALRRSNTIVTPEFTLDQIEVSPG